MRIITTLPLIIILHSTHAQRPGISDLLTLTDCPDTTCVGKFAVSRGYCPFGGNEEDGYLWLRCDHSPTNDRKDPGQVAIGFWLHGAGGSMYSIGTRDTTYANELTEQLIHLDLLPEPGPLAGWTIYRNRAYPDLLVRYQENRMTNIEENRKVEHLMFLFKAIVQR